MTTKRGKPLSGRHRLFALEYLANGRVGYAAYDAVYPGKRRMEVSSAAATRLLKSVKVAAFIEARTQKVVEQLEYNGEQALADIARQARVDVRKLFDEHGQILPPKLWPDDIADAIKTITPTEFGFKVGFYDKLVARITIAKAAGKFVKHVDQRVRVTYGDLLGDGPLPESE